MVPPDAPEFTFLVAGVRVIRVGGTALEVVTAAASVDDAVKWSSRHSRYGTSLAVGVDVTLFV